MLTVLSIVLKCEMYSLCVGLCHSQGWTAQRVSLSASVYSTRNSKLCLLVRLHRRSQRVVKLCFVARTELRKVRPAFLSAILGFLIGYVLLRTSSVEAREAVE